MTSLGPPRPGSSTGAVVSSANSFPEALGRSNSLGAMRESLSRLVSEGLVIAEPQKGFRVAPISQEELEHGVKALPARPDFCLFGRSPEPRSSAEAYQLFSS